jgi:SAM-dependent methyltransferase
MPNFASRNPAQPDFWNERFAAGFTPWDAGGVPAELARFIARSPLRAGGRVLVPGCGSAHDAAALDAAGFDVLAIDYAEQAVARARDVLGPARAARLLRQADFFDFDASAFDWIYERAFLPALPPALWKAWAQRCSVLLAPGGVLAGFFIIDVQVDEPRRGPPFPMTAAELHELLRTLFECEDDRAIDRGESIPVFAGRERWMLWRRR